MSLSKVVLISKAQRFLNLIPWHPSPAKVNTWARASRRPLVVYLTRLHPHAKYWEDIGDKASDTRDDQVLLKAYSQATTLETHTSAHATSGSV